MGLEQKPDRRIEFVECLVRTQGGRKGPGGVANLIQCVFARGVQDETSRSSTASHPSGWVGGHSSEVFEENTVTGRPVQASLAQRDVARLGRGALQQDEVDARQLDGAVEPGRMAQRHVAGFHQAAGEGTDVRHDRLGHEMSGEMLPIAPHPRANLVLGAGEGVDAGRDALEFTARGAPLKLPRQRRIVTSEEDFCRGLSGFR